LRWLLGGVLMLLSIATVFYMDVGSEVMTVLAMAGVLVALARPALPARIPVWAHRLAFPAILMFFLGDLWHEGQLLPAVVRLDILLLLYRGVSHRARRDDLQIVVLGLFLIVVAGVLTVSLLFAAQILVFTACALGLLMVVTITASAEGGQAPKLAVRGVVPGWAAHADWGHLARRLRQVAEWRLVASALALFVGVVALSGLLFLAIPRFQLENSLFLERFVPRKAMTGFSDSIKFGDISEIIEDNGVAFDVDLSDPAQAPATPYWRMVVLDEYRNGGFKLSSPMRSPDIMGKERTASYYIPTLRGVPGAPTWTFYLESGVSRYLPLLGRFVVLRFRDAQNFRYSPYLGLMALRDEPATMTAYRVEGMAPDTPGLADSLFAARWRNREVRRGVPLQLELDLPFAPDKATLAGLTADIGARGLDAAAFAQKANAWLQRLHGYSLSPRIPPGPGDPLVRWMASREPGHCELFAGAFVLAARSAGFPARVVTGFKGGTWNAYSGNYTVRNSDAHAWAEIWDARRGAWLRDDPLAPVVSEALEKKGDAALAALMDRSWSARLNSIRVFWYRRIVNFDQQSQVDTIRAVKAATDSSGKWLRAAVAGAASRVKAWFAGPWNLERAGRVAAVAAAAGALLWALLTGRIRLAALVASRKADPVRREAGHWLRRLEGPPPLIADLQRLRFGHSGTWPRPADVFRRARRAPPSSRRVPGGASRSTS
jgi:transglutaminase-like putative cysteine protease